MKKPILKISVLVAMLALTACSTAPPNLSTTPTKRYAIPATKIIIENYVSEDEPDTAIRSGEYFILQKSVIGIDFPGIIVRDLTSALTPDLDSNNVLEIALLNANVLQEHFTLSSIPFLGLATVYANRKYMCRVDMNFRYGDKSIRQKFEAVNSKPNAWSDMPATEKTILLRNCIDEIIKEISQFSLQLTGTL
jgi:hypothetical protein